MRKSIGCILEISGLIIILITFFTGIKYGLWELGIVGFVLWLVGILMKEVGKEVKV